MPSATYQCTLYPTTYEFDRCTFNGNLYGYQNFDVNMTIKTVRSMRLPVHGMRLCPRAQAARLLWTTIRSADILVESTSSVLPLILL